MPDYKKMYSTLFNAQTDAIGLLQKAQQKTEEMYLASDEADLTLIKPGKKDGETDK